jgi:hypothetical protein
MATVTEQRMQAIETYQSFHDWYLVGVEVDEVTKTVVLNLLFDNRKDRVRLVFSGATRCWISEFLIQNIILTTKILTDFDSIEYAAALAALDKSYPWGRNQPRKLIVAIEATLGAELLIECEAVEAQSLDPRAE